MVSPRDDQGMIDATDSPPLAVVALGGNALLRRGQITSASNQLKAIRAVAAALGPVGDHARLVVTHGNGPQVGLLSLKEDAFSDGEPYPLDVLDAETAGQIGYVLGLEIDNAIARQNTVTVLTRVLVDAADPAFGDPTKPIGPTYAEDRARSLARSHGWDVRLEGKHWRRVVASPEPKRILELSAIRHLVDGGYFVVCGGGGGIPVVASGNGYAGVEAVVDKDLSSALIAVGLDADVLVLATDVDALYEGWGTPGQHPVGFASPEWLRERPFAAGSMGPKVEAACRFVEATGRRAAIGSVSDVSGLVDGTAGTQIAPAGTPTLT